MTRRDEIQARLSEISEIQDRLWEEEESLRAEGETLDKANLKTSGLLGQVPWRLEMRPYYKPVANKLVAKCLWEGDDTMDDRPEVRDDICAAACVPGYHGGSILVPGVCLERDGSDLFLIFDSFEAMKTFCLEWGVKIQVGGYEAAVQKLLEERRGEVTSLEGTLVALEQHSAEDFLV